MFSFRNDPGADGAGVACCDARRPRRRTARPHARRHDAGWRSADWDLVESELGVPILNAYQVHGTRVLTVDADTDARALALEPADALVTVTRNLGVAVRVADCVPVLFADSAAGVVGVAHAGRVGLAAGVLVATVASDDRTGVGHDHCVDRSAHLRAVLRGAGRPAGRGRGRAAGGVRDDRWGTPSLDLGAAAAAQLAGLGCRWCASIRALAPRRHCTPTGGTPPRPAGRRPSSGCRELARVGRAPTRQDDTCPARVLSDW